MSKTTRALAIMGVVAGLGVAGLPLGAYAATDPSATMTVKATVKDTLAITVRGTTAVYQADGDDYTIDTETFERKAGEAVNANDPDAATTYALGFGAYGLIDFGTVNVSSKASDNSKAGQMNIMSNNLGGYNVKAVMNDMIATDLDTIEVGDPTNVPTGSETSKWSYKITEPTNASTDKKTSAINWDTWDTTKASHEIVKRTEAATATTGDTYDLTFGMSVKASQQAGDYTGSLVLTASNN